MWKRTRFSLVTSHSPLLPYKHRDVNDHPSHASEGEAQHFSVLLCASQHSLRLCVIFRTSGHNYVISSSLLPPAAAAPQTTPPPPPPKHSATSPAPLSATTPQNHIASASIHARSEEHTSE